MKVSYSKVSKFLRCPYAYYLTYKENLVRNMPSRPLTFGSDFHKLLEYRGNEEKIEEELKRIKDTFYSLNGSAQSELGADYPQVIAEIFEDYQKVYFDQPLPDKTEEHFEIPIGKIRGETVIFEGVIDGLYFRDNEITIEEHKTFNNKPSISTLTMNTQKGLYAYAVYKMYGKLPESILWDYIKSSPAKFPVWLKTANRFSTAKNSNITPFSFLRACEERGIDITQPRIVEQSKSFQGNVQNYFFRVLQEYQKNMVKDIFRSFKSAIRMMINNQDSRIKNITRDCSWCEFYDICYSEIVGGNTEYTIQKNYRREER